MTDLECVREIKSNGNIISGYVLRDKSGNEREFRSKDIKYLIETNKVNISNLKMKSDGRLFMTKQSLKLDDVSVNRIISKARLLNNVSTLKTADRHECYLVKYLPETYILYIPDDVTGEKCDGYGHGWAALFDNKTQSVFIEAVKHSILYVYGGKNVLTLSSVFKYAKMKEVNLTYFTSDKVMDMSFIFNDAVIDNINFGTLSAKNILDMRAAFSGLHTTFLDIGFIHGQNIRHARMLFGRCMIDTVNIKNLSLEYCDCTHMFEHANIHKIDFNELKIYRPTDFDSAFRGARINNIVLNHIDTSTIKDFSLMFDGCISDVIDISKFSLESAETTVQMFKDCNADTVIYAKTPAPKLRAIDGMFLTSKIRFVDISNSDFRSPKELKDMFFGAHIQEIDMSDIVIGQEAFVNEEAFRKCTASIKHTSLGEPLATVVEDQNKKINARK